jgi:hypothetical protein
MGDGRCKSEKMSGFVRSADFQLARFLKKTGHLWGCNPTRPLTLKSMRHDLLIGSARKKTVLYIGAIRRKQQKCQGLYGGRQSNRENVGFCRGALPLAARVSENRSFYGGGGRRSGCAMTLESPFSHL